MKNKKVLIIIAIVLLVLSLSLMGLVISRGTDSTLPKGTSVAGLDLSSLTLAEARAKIIGQTQKRELTLLSKKVRLTADIERKANVAPVMKRLEKIEAEQSFLARVLGQSEKTAVPLDYGYNKPRLRALFLRLEKRVEKRPESAQVLFTGQLKIKAGQIGKKLLPGSWKQVKAGARDGETFVLLSQKPWRPRLLSKRDVLRDSPAILVVDKSAFTLHLYKRGKLVKSYPVATGKPGFETPSGSFRIANKAVDPAWSVPEWGGELAGQVIPGGSPQNPLINRWLGIADGVGIHGTSDVYSLGSAASHGCIRMDPDQVIELYNQVPVNARIIIL